MNNFNKQLDISEEHNRIALIKRALVSQFGDSPFIQETDPEKQSLGIDRYFGILKIEYKTRETYYPDILFEIISNSNTGSLGWAEKHLCCDFFVYTFYAAGIVYIFYYKSLKDTWEKNKHIWILQHRRVTANNSNYNTISVAVPIVDVLQDTVHSIYNDNKEVLYK